MLCVCTPTPDSKVDSLSGGCACFINMKVCVCVCTPMPDTKVSLSGDDTFQ